MVKKVLNFCFIVVLFFVVLVLGFYLPYYNSREAEKLKLEQKYEELKNLNLSKLRSLSDDELKKIGIIFDDLLEGIYKLELSRQEIDDWLPEFDKIREEFGWEMSKRDSLKRKRLVKRREYEESLREKGITDENIIKQEMEKYDKAKIEKKE